MNSWFQAYVQQPSLTGFDKPKCAIRMIIVYALCKLGSVLKVYFWPILATFGVPIMARLSELIASCKCLFVILVTFGYAIIVILRALENWQFSVLWIFLQLLDLPELATFKAIAKCENSKLAFITLNINGVVSHNWL